jgi:hypothetical protein
MLDGRAVYGKTLADYAAWVDFVALGIRRGWKAPPLTRVATVAPLTAWVQQGFWVVTCPECAGKPELELQAVWLDGPLVMWCTVCGNAGAGGHWRPVALPEQHDVISTLLAVRPLAMRTWVVDEPVTNLVAENVQRGLPVPDEYQP